jgi:hypothetical protein
VQQEEAGFDEPQMAEKRAAYLRDEARKSPLKDKPAARRSPAGLVIDDPGPPGYAMSGHTQTAV